MRGLVGMVGSCCLGVANAGAGDAVAVPNDGQTAFAQPVPGRSAASKHAFSVGNNFFNTNWVIAPGEPANRDGLGPLFHARSCSACHPFDGRGAPPTDGEVMTGLLFRLGTPNEATISTYGHQLAPRAIPGALPEGDVAVRTTEEPGTFADGGAFSLLRPTYEPKGWNYGPPPADLRLSPRVSMAVFGVGLLEAVPASQITAAADPDDRDGDGISGRAAVLKDGHLGRFGWKAAVPTVREQAAAAMVDDMGLTNALHPQESWTEAQREALGKFPSGAEAGGTEVDEATLDRITTYLRLLAPPARRRVNDPAVQRGEALFTSLRCVACHRAEWTTGATDLPEISGKLIHPYSDLLLHDMGPGLADDRPEGAATGTEWRTAPLWGLGLLPVVNAHERLLHDGRARSPEEAILWHDGEARGPRENFRALPKADREALVAFLRSL